MIRSTSAKYHGTRTTDSPDDDGGRLFDAHCHLFERGFRPPTDPAFSRPGGELAAYEEFRAAHNIVRSLVIGYDDGEYAGNSDYIEDLAADLNWIVPIRYVATDGDQPADRTAAELPTMLSAYPSDTDAAQSLADRMMVGGPLGAPRLVSLNIRPPALPPLAAAMRSLPETWFLISHLGLPGPVRDTDEAARVLSPLWELAGLPNVSVKISGQYAATRRPYPHDDVRVIVDVLADRMGTDALVWGSDFSPSLAAGPFAEAVECAVPTGASQAERGAIYFGNGQRMLDQYCKEQSAA